MDGQRREQDAAGVLQAHFQRLGIDDLHRFHHGENWSAGVALGSITWVRFHLTASASHDVPSWKARAWRRKRNLAASPSRVRQVRQDVQVGIDGDQIIVEVVRDISPWMPRER